MLWLFDVRDCTLPGYQYYNVNEYADRTAIKAKLTQRLVLVHNKPDYCSYVHWHSQSVPNH